MASGFFALFDDIATLLDDVAAMTKLGVQKTAGVISDDLAVGANQLAGFAAKRELPIIWKVAKGSLINKGILIPTVLGVSALGTALGINLIGPMLMIGGSYLCYEGMEKLTHGKSKHGDKEHKELLTAITEDQLMAFEKGKIKEAIRTDMILSAEILILALGMFANAPLEMQAGALALIGGAMTGIVYGTVAGIVKLDDLGLKLLKNTNKTALGKVVRGIGRGLVNASPKLMRSLSVIGTAAMFMVGGQIMLHNIPAFEHIVHELPNLSIFGMDLVSTGADIMAGLATGGVVMGAVTAGVGAAAAIGKFLPAPMKAKARNGMAKIKAGINKVSPARFLKKQKTADEVQTPPAPPAAEDANGSALKDVPSITEKMNDAAEAKISDNNTRTNNAEGPPPPSRSM